jgi:hypothetical protein
MQAKSFSESVDPVTIAVVGALGTGKSTVIHKGAKQFGLSDFTVLSAPPGMLGVQTPLRCTLVYSPSIFHGLITAMINRCSSYWTSHRHRDSRRNDSELSTPPS